ncbi:hypothetical protein BB559_000864 [Furculomyces boomerangus]|uniref:Vacuolar ATPase assembly integral membrane protein VMA21 n=2 Tax=Harpellales TaxID=61421 RepID=A0A2T9Z3T2_9FUNG|nr:hypothetical protein BB559_000864 [Furculomyces boomerangus]PVZ98991.1 hypothetical protein BB558_005002 [Smittium angustum]
MHKTVLIYSILSAFAIAGGMNSSSVPPSSYSGTPMPTTSSSKAAYSGSSDQSESSSSKAAYSGSSDQSESSSSKAVYSASSDQSESSSSKAAYSAITVSETKTINKYVNTRKPQPKKPKIRTKTIHITPNVVYQTKIVTGKNPATSKARRTIKITSTVTEIDLTQLQTHTLVHRQSTILKFAFHSVLIFLGPIGIYFTTSPTISAIGSVIFVNVVLIMYVLSAYRDEAKEMEIYKNEKKKES